MTREQTSSAGRDFWPFPMSVSGSIVDTMEWPRDRRVSTEAGDRMADALADTSTRAAIARIDDALAVSISRNTFSRDQALRTLGEVEASVIDAILADRVAAVVNEAAASYGGGTFVERGRFLDTLLDIRAVLVGLSPNGEGAV